MDQFFKCLVILLLKVTFESSNMVILAPRFTPYPRFAICFDYCRLCPCLGSAWGVNLRFSEFFWACTFPWTYTVASLISSVYGVGFECYTSSMPSHQCLTVKRGKGANWGEVKKCAGPLNPLDVASVEGLAAVCAHVHVHIRAVLPACLCVYASMISRRNQRWEHRSRDLDDKVLVPISCAQAALGPGTWLPALWPESCYCAELMESSNLVSKTCPGRPKASIDSSSQIRFCQWNCCQGGDTDSCYFLLSCHHPRILSQAHIFTLRSLVGSGSASSITKFCQPSIWWF